MFAIFNIFPNYFYYSLVPDCSGKISIFPKFFISQLFFYFRVFLEFCAGTSALQHHYHFGNGAPRWKGQKDIEMIFCNLKGK